MKITTTVVVTLSLAALAQRADAVTFNVSAQVIRPGWFVPDADGNASNIRYAFNGSTTPVRRWLPASHQHVTVYQPGGLHPIYCGEAFTDDNGLVSAQFECGSAYPTQLYLEVDGLSSRGFEVGTFNEVEFYLRGILYGIAGMSGGLPALAALGFPIVADITTLPPQTFHWTSPTAPLAPHPFGVTADFGVVGLGGQLFTTANEHRVAAVYEQVDMTYRELDALGASIPFTTSIVNSHVGNTSSAMWTTIHHRSGMSMETLMGSIPHEYGHVIYNVNHSDAVTYWPQAVHYLRNHSACVPTDHPMAHYEGFAESIRDLVRRLPGLTFGTDDFNSGDSCTATPSLQNSGNVTDIYTATVLGTSSERTAPADQAQAVDMGSDRLGLHPARVLFDGIPSTGPHLATPSGWWSAYWDSACSQTVDGAPAFCGSERFRCWVMSRDALAGDLPAPFGTDDCAPSQPQIARIVTLPPALHFGRATRIEIAPLTNADDITIVAVLPNDVVQREVVARPGSIAHAFELPNCVTAEIRVLASNEYGMTWSAWETFAQMDENNCRPQRTNVASVAWGPGGLYATLDASPDSDTYVVQAAGNVALFNAQSTLPSAALVHGPLTVQPDPGGRVWLRVITNNEFGPTHGLTQEFRVPRQPLPTPTPGQQAPQFP